MLTSLLIKHVALIDEIRIGFRSGLTVITGETGAGKSILIDALALALGGRADTTLIRQGADRAVVEAEFDAAGLHALQELVEECGAEWQPVLILRREVSLKSGSRCFVNDSPVQVGKLRQIGDRLVDIHGQHEHQSLLRPETHQGILDRCGGIERLLASYTRAYETLADGIRQLRSARDRRDRIEERRIVAAQQLREIAAVNPHEHEDEDAERELKLMQHAERLATHSNEIVELLYDADDSVSDKLGRSLRLLGELAEIDDTLRPLKGEIESASASVTETARSLRDYLGDIDFSPQRAEQLRHRLAELDELKRRFRATLPEVLEKKKELAAELEGLDNIDTTIATLEAQVAAARAEGAAMAAALTAERTKEGKALGREIVARLAELGIPNAVFETRLSRSTYAGTDEGMYLQHGTTRVLAGERGWDHVEFYLSTNLGEDARPLARVVSGGEVSRIMLALKSIFAGREDVPVMVFDEIDVGVSGGIAKKVGQAMAGLARQRQIFSITHLPQIAGVGSAHLLVEKREEHGRTVTLVRELDDDERAREVARLLSGDTVTDAALHSARELMEK